MARAGLVGVVVVAWAGVASAGGATRKVTVETDPPGAKVYIGSKEDGVACEPTPCSVDAPLGDGATIIVELERYGPEFVAVDVKRAGKPPSVKVKLKLAIGTYVIDSPGAKGASIRVDDVDKGKVPQRVEVEPGGHKVTVAIAGKTLFDDYVNVDDGQEVPIAPKSAPVATAPPAKVDPVVTENEGGGGGGGSGGDPVGHVETSAPEAPRDRFLVASALVDIGFRHFSYVNARTLNLHDESEDGNVLAGPAVELWPAELLHARHLRGLSVYLRAQFAINHQTVTDSQMKITGPVSNGWTSYEASLRQRWTIADTAAIEASGGWVMDQYQFATTSTNDLNLVPDAQYQSIRVGVRAAILAGSFEPYLAGETRIVLSGGELQSRFETAKASGLRGAVGAVGHLGAFAVRVEGSLMQYSWNFSTTQQKPMFDADGATDSVIQVSIAAGYQY